MENKTIKIIGQYRVVTILQEMPDWNLYRAVDNENGKSVLIKTFYPTLRWSEDSLNELFNRLSSLRLFEHKYLLPILDFGKSNKTPYIVFPDLQARSLQDYVEAPAVNSRQFLELFIMLAEALDFLHHQDILHGMLSPDNILVDTDITPRLMDFGLHDILKKVLLENMPGEYQNLSIARIKYASPEQVLGRDPTSRSDVYAFGQLFYFCASGSTFVGGKTAPEIAIDHLKPEEKWSGKMYRNLSAGALKFLRRCLRIDPENRYPGFSEVVRVLEHLARSRKPQVRILPRTSTLPSRKVKIPALVYGGTALILLLGLALLGWLFRRPVAPPPAENSPTPLPATTWNSPTPRPADTGTIPTLLPSTPTAPPVIETALPTSPSPVTSLRPALEGELVGINSGAITLNNLKNIREISRLGFGKPEDVAVSPDQSNYAIASSTGVFIYASASNTLRTWIDPQDWATSVRFSPSGNRLAVGLLSGDIQIWDWEHGTQAALLSGHTARVSKMLFSNNERYLYSASYDQNIIVWDMQTMKQFKSIAAHSKPINDISVTSDGRRLASCSNDGLVRIWDLNSVTKLDEFDFEGNCEAAALSSDGEYLAVGGDTGYVFQWNINLQQRRTDIVPMQRRVWTIQYIENDSKIFVGLDGGNSTILIANQEKYTFRGVTIPSVDPRLKDALGAAFEFDETFAPYGQGTSNVSIRWDGTVKHRTATVWNSSYDSLDRLSLSLDGTYVVAGGKRGLTAIWNTTTNQPVVRYTSDTRLPPGDPVAPDNSAFIIIIPYYTLSEKNQKQYPDGLYERVALPLKSTKNFTGIISGGTVSYARDGSLLVAGNPTQSKAWDFLSGYEVNFNSFPKDNCWVTISSNNGEVLQVLSAAGTFLVWDDMVRNICLKSYQIRDSLFAASSNHDFLTYTTPLGKVEGYDPQANKLVWPQPHSPAGTVTALGVSPDGSIVVLGTKDGKLIFLDGKNGKQVLETTGNFGSVTCIKFSGDGKWMATVGTDGAVRLFGVPNNP